VVPGDMLVLEAGTKVPADARLTSVSSLQADESILTGESTPVEKQSEEVSESSALADRASMVFAGTVITIGRARAVAVSTGHTTEVGQIAATVAAVGIVQTPLQVRIHRFARLIAVLIVTLAVASFGWGVLVGHEPREIAMVMVGLAVAAIPEGLPIVLVIVLAVGMRRMVTRNVIIRRLPAVETLGSCTVIGSDKTGTLTENRMTVQRLLTSTHEYEVSGGAYEAEGAVQPGEPAAAGDAPEPSEDEELKLLLTAGALCNDATIALDPDRGEYEVRGDPTEVALLVSAARLGLTREALEELHPRVDEIPFSSERSWAATFHRSGNQELLFLKGAPERVLERCSKVHGGGPLDPARVLADAHRMAEEGRRVLAMAYRELPGGERPADPRDLTFLGLQTMMDPPRAEAIEAVAGCQRAGIRVYMITGDHPTTGLAIGRQLGIAAPDAEALTGAEVEEMDDDTLADALGRVTVFARMAPEHKHRLVRLLQARGEIVAVTGDGVNDAPALKAADIGVAMGGSGTDVAREASDMVITDDNFASIFAAVEEGRVVFDNVRKATFFLVSTGVGVVVVVLTSLVAGFPLPYVPAQLLWMNLVTNGIQDVALAFEPGEPDVIHRRPRPPAENVISGRLWERLAITGLWMGAGTLALFLLVGDPWEDLGYAQSVALTTMVLFQAFHVGNSRSETVSAFRKSPFSNRFLLIGTIGALLIHIGALHFGPTQFVLRVEPIALVDWAWMFAVAATIVPVVELHKRFRGERMR
jgi:potassium/sodium efflux P-type ATPase